MTEVALRDYVHEIDGMIENSAYDAAINHSRHVLQQFPKYVEVYRVLGKALLEKGDDTAAADVFQRVLSVDPEDFVARVGLSIIHDRAGQLDSAIWHMERAFDLMPSNEIIQSELRRLYARRDGVEPERVSLTRGALARMYAHGDLYAEAIANLRQLLQDQPDRLDLKILLTEVLWRDDQRVDAADLAQYILAELPYCLKANLIYGKLLHDSGSSDSDVSLRRAQAADPDNVQAVRLFGAESPLVPQQTMLARLEQPSYGELLEGEGGAAEPEEVPDWLRGLAELNTPSGMLEAPESATNPPLATGLHMPGTEQQRGEIPEWLQGLSVPPPEPAEPAAEIPSWLTQLGAASVSPTPEPTTAVAADDWLNQLQTSAPAEPVAAKSDEEVPDWIRQLGTGELKAADLPVVEPTAEETPDWLSQLGGFNQPEQPLVTITSSAQAEETADWLSDLSAAASTETATPSEPDEMPDWLRQIRASDNEATTEESGTPDWLSGLRDNTPPLAEPTAPGETPDWLAQLQTSAADLEEVPPFEDHQPESEPESAPRFGVDADRDTVNRLIAAFESDTVEPSVAQAEPAIEAPEPLTEIEAPVAEVASEPEPSSVAPVADLPEEMPSADDALAFLARLAIGKEDQLRAEAEQEGESRMAAIMGRKPVEPAKPIEPEPEPTEPKDLSLSDVVTPVAEAGAGLIGLAGMAVAGVAHTVHGEAEEQPVAEAEPVAEVASAVESAPAPELPEAMPSADDALAFLARLAAGKEDQLRAEAEQEGESRMAAIMGRKPVEPEKPIEPEPEPVEVEPAATEPVADWISQLAATPTFDAAQPTPEGEMPDWLRALQPTADEESGVTAAFEVAEPTPESDMPDWLRAMQPTDETAIDRELEVGAPIAETSVEPMEPVAVGEQPDWLHDLPSVETSAAPTPSADLPDWLQAMQPEMIEEVAESESIPAGIVETAETVAAEPIVEISSAETPVFEEQTAEETPVVITSAEVETPAPVVTVEPEPLAAVVEPEPIETPTPAVAEVTAAVEQIEDQTIPVGSMDWWTQVAEDEGETPLAELPPVVKVAAVASAAAARAPREREPLRRPERLERPMRDLRPRETRMRETRETRPTPPPPPTVVSVDVDPLVAQLESDKYNHTVRLELARAWWAMGNRDSALAEYAKLVNPATVEDLSPEELAEREEFDFVDAGPLADDIVADLERIVEVDEQPASLRLLGDMHMKVGNLSRALEMYRRALNQL